MSVNIERIFLI